MSPLCPLDLTSAKIDTEFHLGSVKNSPAEWKDGGKLILRNTKVSALQDLREAWPDELDLVGFTYSQLGGFAAVDNAGNSYSMDTRVSLLKEWLEKQKPYSPEPYKQLAKVLTEAGQIDKAKEILFTSKQRERKKSSWSNWLILTLQRIFIGYGYNIVFLPACWVIGITLLGALVFWTARKEVTMFKEEIWSEKKLYYIFNMIVYSLDMLLPLIKLNKSHYGSIKIKSGQKYYFYVHILFGYVIVSYFIAGLLGIIK